ncbi:MAG: CHAD domain-containing protein [Actinomycetes bacterium]
MTVPATASAPYTPQFQVEPRLQLGRSEPLAEGVKRVALDELERAAEGFFEPEENFHSAVRSARDSIERVRALLQAVKGELGPEAFAYEDRFLSRTSSMLDEVREAAAVTDAAMLVRQLYGEFLAEGTFEETVAGLRRRRDIVTLKTMEDPHLVGQVVANLEKAHSRYRTWPTDPDVDYGVRIRDDYEAIAPGLGATYEEGRRYMVAAYRGAGDGFGEWRARVRTLRHQLEFLMPLWPEVLVGLVYTLDTLGLFLGEDRDHSDLLDLLRVRPDLCPNPRERSLLFAVVTQRRTELKVASEILGRRVFAEQPDSFTHRFGEYWGARAQALTAGLETLSVH